jgi:quinol-cytochrome oxidoreductase complex cytochrome b subunit
MGTVHKFLFVNQTFITLFLSFYYNSSPPFFFVFSECEYVR